MLEISLSDSESGIFQKDIADRQELSVKYLDPIISKLKSAGLITNVAKKKSGYKLTKKSEEINMLDIYNAFLPGIKVVECVSDDFDCSMKNVCGVKDFWSDLNGLISDYFKSVTLADLQEKRRQIIST